MPAGNAAAWRRKRDLVGLLPVLLEFVLELFRLAMTDLDRPDCGAICLLKPNRPVTNIFA